MLNEQAFSRIPPQAEQDNELGPSISAGRETLLRLSRKPTVWVCVILLAVLTLGAVLVPLLSPFDYASQNIAFAHKPFFSPDPVTGQLHWFGTDRLGRDIFVRVWFSVRVSMLIAIAVTLIDSVIGVVYGSISGYLGGVTDSIMMRVLEVISGIPYLIIVLLLVALFPRGLGTIILAYSLTGWTGTARLVRGQVLHLRSQEFVLASRTMGASMWQIIRWDILPNIMGLMIVSITLDIPAVIFTEAFLSMLGLGITPPTPSLGIMANDGISIFQLYPAQLAVPALIICAIMLCFNLLGDNLQDALEPGNRRIVTFGRIVKHKKS